MTYELTDEILRAINDEADTLVIDGEVFEHVTEESEGMDDNGKWRNDIWKRKSDGAYFMTTIGWARYGYEDYGFELFMCDRKMTQVERVEIVTYEWKPVKEGV